MLLLRRGNGTAFENQYSTSNLRAPDKAQSNCEAFRLPPEFTAAGFRQLERMVAPRMLWCKTQSGVANKKRICYIALMPAQIIRDNPRPRRRLAQRHGHRSDSLRSRCARY